MGEGSSLPCNENAATLAWGEGLKPAGTQGSPPGRALIPNWSSPGGRGERRPSEMREGLAKQRGGRGEGW